MTTNPMAKQDALLASVQDDATAIHDDGPRKQRLADALFRAKGFTAQGTETACKAALATLAGVQDEAKALKGVDNKHVRACVSAAEVVPHQLQALVWTPAIPVLSVGGFADAKPGDTMYLTLTLNPIPPAGVTATIAIEGLDAADLADGQLSRQVVVRASSSVSIPLAQRQLATTKVATVTVTAPGVKLAQAGFQFRLLSNYAVSIVQPFSEVRLDRAAPVVALAVLGRDGDLTATLSAPVSVTGGALPPVPAEFQPAAARTSVPVTFPPAVTALRAQAPVAGRFDVAGGPGFDFSVVPPDGAHPDGSAFSGMTPDNSDMAVDKADAVGAWRGSPLTCYTVFNWGHKGWAEFDQSYTKAGWAPARVVPILARKGIVPVCTIPGLVVGGNDLDAAIRGDYDQHHKACAAWLASLPWTTEVVGRISRECNDPNQPFFYGHDLATKKKWLAAHEHIVGIYKDALGDRFLFSWCVMKRADGWQDAYPSFCDIVDIDAYLNTPVVKTQADFDKHWGTVSPHIDFALARNKPVAFSEWAIKDVDQPLGVTLQTGQYKKLAAQHVLHHENYFNSTDHHAIFGSNKYPESAAAYVAAYGKA